MSAPAAGRSSVTIETIRKRARAHMEKGAVTDGYQAPLETVLRLLNEALATEIVSLLRYKRHYYMASGIHAQAVAAEFLEYANEEQAHADMIAARIMQLGGEPNFSPDGLTERSHSVYAAGSSLVDMIHGDLIAERMAIDSYSQMIRFLADRDSTTRVVLEAILAAEEERAEDLADLLVTLVTQRELRETDRVMRQRSTQAARSIAEITAEDVRATAALEAQYVVDPRLSGLAIDVSTLEGVVTLSGHVDSGFDLARAIDIAMALDSVREVISRLRVVRAVAEAKQRRPGANARGRGLDARGRRTPSRSGGAR